MCSRQGAAAQEAQAAWQPQQPLPPQQPQQLTGSTLPRGRQPKRGAGKRGPAQAPGTRQAATPRMLLFACKSTEFCSIAAC